MAKDIFTGRSYRKDYHPSWEQDQFGLFSVDMSEGVRLPVAFYPHFSLPVGPYIRNENDFIVIPKGKIVSIVGQTCNGTYEGWTGVGPNEFPVPSGQFPIEPSGTPPYESVHNRLTYSITPGLGVTPPFDGVYSITADAYDGLPLEIFGLIVPANGGTQVTMDYSDADVEHGTVKTDGTLVASEESLIIPANKPCGIVYTHVYRYIEGRYLNWTNQPPVGILTDYLIRRPFVNISLFNDKFGAGLRKLGATLLNNDPMYKLSRIWSFMYGDSSDCSSGLLAPGSAVTSDTHGNYVPLGIESGFTIGRLVLIDHRMPKQFLEWVDGFPNSGAGASTETGGLPWELYHFAKDLLLLAGVSKADRDIADIVEMVQSGIFGYAYINVHIS